MTTVVGQVRLDVPPGRNADFKPASVPNMQRRLQRPSGDTISLHAQRMTTGDIQAHLAEISDTSISTETISRITDAVVDDV